MHAAPVWVLAHQEARAARNAGGDHAAGAVAACRSDGGPVVGGGAPRSRPPTRVVPKVLANRNKLRISRRATKKNTERAIPMELAAPESAVDRDGFGRPAAALGPPAGPHRRAASRQIAQGRLDSCEIAKWPPGLLRAYWLAHIRQLWHTSGSSGRKPWSDDGTTLQDVCKEPKNRIRKPT